MLRSAIKYHELSRSQWLDPKSMGALQDQKVRQLIRHAYETVPYYRNLFIGKGIRPDDIHGAKDLRHLPLTSRSQLQDLDSKDITSSKMNPTHLVKELTSGSTGRPFEMFLDRHFLAVRNALFLRVLVTAGYRPGEKLVLITDPKSLKRTTWYRWHYLSIRDPTEELLREINRIRPNVLYGCLSPLRQLAELSHRSGVPIHSPRVIISTAESLDEQSRSLLKATFSTKVLDAYGLTEMGMIACECDKDSGYHVSEETVAIAYIPTDQEETYRVAMTNLELYSMPLIHYEAGDLVSAGRSGPCPCGRSTQRWGRIEGRLVDSLVTRNGELLSPYRLTTLLEHIPSLKRYQVIQEAPNRFLLLYEGDATQEETIHRQAQDMFYRLFGPPLQLAVSKRSDLTPPPGEKFRVVKNLVPGETRAR